MTKRLPTVRELAIEANLDLEDAIIILMDKGFEIKSPSQIIFRRDLYIARSALNLPSSSPRTNPCSIEVLAERAGRSKEEIAGLLFREGILAKRRHKNVPSFSLEKAEIILGLRIVTLPPVIPDQVIKPIKERKKPKPEWPTVGPTQELIYLNSKDVLDFHYVLVKDFAKTKDPIDPPGLRSESLLDSAVHRQKTCLGEVDKYPTVAMTAASLLFGIVLDHPFHNGNKRTAIVATLVFLDKNGWILNCDQDEMYMFLLQLADHKLINSDGQHIQGADEEVIRVARWIQSKIKRIALREQRRPFRLLRAILEEYDCKIEVLTGNRVNIKRGQLKVQVGYRNEGAEVDRSTIHQIRKDLQLDEIHGYDSDIFYNMGSRIPDFINKYRKLLDKLAKV